MTAQLSCHAQKLLVITWLEFKWEHKDIPLNLNYDGKIISEMDLKVDWFDVIVCGIRGYNEQFIW